MNTILLRWTFYLILLIIVAVIIYMYAVYKKHSPTQFKITRHAIKAMIGIPFRKRPQRHMDISDPGAERTNNLKNFLKQIIRWMLIIAFLLFAGTGQLSFFNFPEGEKRGIYFYLLAIAVFSLLTWYMRTTKSNCKEMQEPAVSQQRLLNFSEIKKLFFTNPKKSTLLVLSIIFSILSLILLITKPEQNSHWDIFFLWIASFLCYAFIFINKQHFHFLKWINQHKVDICLILTFTVLGGIFRFYELGKIPSIIDGDEGRFGLIIVDILEGRITNMFKTVYGNSSMYFFFLAGMMKLFGNNVTILRIGSAIGGTLTIPILYLFANKFFNRRTAIISTAVLVVSNFHIHFSHIMSVTSIQDGLFATISLYLFYTGLQNKSSSRMTMAGLALGLALYIYMGARLIILLIPVYLLIMFVLHSHTIKSNTSNILIFSGALLIISLPMIYWAISNPNLFNARAQQIGILQSGWLKNEALQTGQTQIHIFFQLFKQAFLTTIFYPSHGFHLSSWPMLDIFSSIFFIAGLTYSILHTKDARYLLLNGWFWSGIIVGGALIILPSLNSYRIMIVFPVICLFTGIGLDRLLFFMKGNSLLFKLIEVTTISSFIILISIYNLNLYFVSYAPNCRYADPNTRLASHIASFASTLDQEVELYLLTAPQLRAHTHLSMQYLSPGRTYNEFIDPLIEPPEALEKDKEYAFFFLPIRNNELEWIEERFPGGTVEQIYDCNVSVITVYLWAPN